MIIHGDSLEKLKDLAENSIDSIVTDPPYELGFMGKSWDSTGIANNVELWKECLRVLKPGGHLLAFSGTRTYHRMAVAIEDAGFEVRDMIEWVYGSGFPKSLNVGKAVDKLQGNDRETIREYETHDIRNAGLMDKKGVMTVSETKGTSEWEGWGTALKPSHEPICMARKPLAEKTVAENVLKYGTGGINIDESRVEIPEDDKGGFRKGDYTFNCEATSYKMRKDGDAYRKDQHPQGRFPANLIHDGSEEVRECFPETGKSNIRPVPKNDIGDGSVRKYNVYAGGYKPKQYQSGVDDNGGNASRFFKSIVYQAKASKSERNKGCEDLEAKQVFGDNGGTYQGLSDSKLPSNNNHPTVKPIALMEYLIKMVTPKGGTVLDPFMGSGSTGCACVKNGYEFIGIEMEEEYIKIAEARINSYK